MPVSCRFSGALCVSDRPRGSCLGNRRSIIISLMQAPSCLSSSVWLLMHPFTALTAEVSLCCCSLVVIALGRRPIRRRVLHRSTYGSWYGMQSSRASVVRSGKVAGARSHTLSTPGVYLPKANPAFPYEKGKHFRPLASPRGIFFPFLAHFVERDRQPQTSVYYIALLPIGLPPFSNLN